MVLDTKMCFLADRGLADLIKVFINNKNGTIEEHWLHSYLIPVPKASKDHTKLQGYCIITMSNMVGKLLGKIISRTVLYHIEQVNLFSPGLGRCWRQAATQKF